MLLKKYKLLLKQKDVASTFNKHFGSITDSLNLFSWPEDTSLSSRIDTINSIINPVWPGMGYFYPTHQFIYDISGNIDGINIIFCDFS